MTNIFVSTLATSIRATSRRLAAGLLLSAVVFTSPMAHADKPVFAGDPESLPVDASKLKKDWVLLQHNAGYLYASAKEESDETFWSTDGKSFYRVPVRGGSGRGDAAKYQFSRTFVAPRAYGNKVRNPSFGNENEKGEYEIFCKYNAEKREDVSEPLKLVPKAAAAKLIASAKFYERRMVRMPEFIGRDDRGVYILIDRLRDAYGGKAHRIFRGPKGAMQQLQMTNVVSDSAGEIYSTKGGELRIVIDGNSSDGTAQWIEGKNASKIKTLPVEDNIALIYVELGVYPLNVGTPCDSF